MTRRVPSAVVVLVALIVLVGVAPFVLSAVLSYRRPIDPFLAPPTRASFDVSLVGRGAELAPIGNCVSCHTAQDGAPYADGVALTTAFGKIDSANITPDVRTGIGGWSEAAFVRALRDGVARDGSHLYPAFPYDHFTRLSNADLHALYAFMMTHDPVHATVPANALHFPFGYRPLLAGWQLLFLHKQPSQPDRSQGVEWNRGAYLVDALAHCSSCHTPRNTLGAEKRHEVFDGSGTSGWYAPPLNTRSPSPQPWSVAQLTQYLHTGMTNDHAIAGGPMHEVVANLGQASEADVRAIATYIVATMGSVSAARQTRATASQQRATWRLADIHLVDNDKKITYGAPIYAGACASCHDQGRGASSTSALRLPLAVALYDDDPQSFLRIVREGIVPADGAYGRWMPAFGRTLDDEQLTALAAYLRRVAADLPPWPRLASAVKESWS